MKSKNRKLFLSGAICLAALLSFGRSQAADDYPTKPIRIVVSYAPGGGTDVAARIFATQLSSRIGQSVIVENRPGATGRIGTTSVAQAAPDGYTLLFGTAAELTIASVTAKSLPYRPGEDFVPISQVGWLPNMLVASAKFPPNSVKELIAYAKAHPGAVNYGSGGNYSQPHLIGLRFNIAAGIDTVHVPYKGSGPMITDLAENQIQYSFSSPQPMVDLIGAGKLKALAVLSDKRLESMPDLPTMGESGLPGFVDSNWLALMAPRGTPPAVVEKLHRACVESLQAPALLESWKRLYIVPFGSSPQQLAQFIAGETEKYRDLARKINLQPE
ncbi:Bug family tripartite tricarboxylate transporter substrate binding protein [Bordetella bronchiseptica]